MRRPIVLACLLFVLVASPVPAATDPPNLEAEVDAFLAPLLAEDLISGSILIARGGKLELAKGYGPANREHDVPCNAETRYRLASVTKSFTAAAILLLEERGLLRLGDTLDKFVPDYPNGDKITLHHLLTHTSGVVNYSKLPDHYKIWAMPHTMDEVIARFRDEPLRFEPGERFEYSNSGYVLLTKVIETVSGVSYEAFLRASFFDPLGMDHTGMDSHTEVIPHRATGHYNFGDGIVQAPYLNIEFTSGAGGLYSTVLDLYKWDRALYTDRPLSEAIRDKMFTPRIRDYAYGWFVREELGHKLIEHRGGINGFLTMIQRFVDDDVTVITLFNYVSTFSREVNRGLAAIALGEEYGPLLDPVGVKVPEKTLKELAGSYRIGENPIEATLEGGKLWITDSEGEKSAAIPQNEKTFYLRESNALLHFLRGDDGRVERLIVQQSEHMIPCPRVE